MDEYTLEQRLSEVNKAIHAVLLGASPTSSAPGA